MSGQPELEPHDLEAEQSLLGAMLVNPQALAVAIGIVEPDALYRASHATIFAVLMGMHAQGVPVDTTTVGAQLERQGSLDDVKGREYLHYLTERLPTAANVRQYCAIVIERAGQRRKLHAQERLRNAIECGDADAEGIALAQLSSAFQRDSHGVSRLPIYRAPDLSEMVVEQPLAVLPGYVYQGAITLFVAKAKTGKTTFLLHLAAALLNSREFLSRATLRLPVFIYTEEGRETMVTAMRRAGVHREKDLHLLFKQDARGRGLEEVLGALRAEAGRRAQGSACLLILDTISGLSGAVNDDENNSGFAQRVVDAVRPFTEAGWAVVLTQHMRKSGGDLEDSMRGSSAFGGAVDIICSMTKGNASGHDGRRELHAAGRFDKIPRELVIELTDGVYAALGQKSDLERATIRRQLLELLPSEAGRALSEACILETLGEGASRTTLQRALKDLVDGAQAAKEKGAGGAGNRAWGYWLLPSKERGLGTCEPAFREDNHAFSRERQTKDLPRGPSLIGQLDEHICNCAPERRCSDESRCSCALPFDDSDEIGEHSVIHNVGGHHA